MREEYEKRRVTNFSDNLIGATSCNDTPWKTFSFTWSTKKKPCAFLNTMMVHKRNKYCNGRFSNASEICPQTCLGQCPCKDDKSTEFIDKKQRKKSWLWLSGMKQISKEMFIDSVMWL